MREEIIGSARLILGDCREIAPTLARPSAIISDPPYGIGWRTDTTRFSSGRRGSNHRRGDGRNDFGPIRGDAEPFDPMPWVDAADRVVLWGANHFAERLSPGTTLVWVKKASHLWGTFLSDAEIAWMRGGQGVYCCEVPWSPPARAMDAGGDLRHPRSIHPTQKPTALMKWCIGKARVPAGGVVLDPFAGSGSTIVAALSLGHPTVGIEVDPRFFDVMLRRVEQAHRQADLFVPRPAPKPAVTAELF